MPELDSPAFAETYRRVFPLILNKCRRMMSDPSEAQDLAQDVFVRLWRSRALIDEPRALTAWLYRTCTHLAIDRGRSRGRADQLALALGELGTAETADPETRSASRRTLGEIAARTPPLELEVALLSRVDGLTHPEIAEVVDISERTVRRLLARFQARFPQPFAERASAGGPAKAKGGPT